MNNDTNFYLFVGGFICLTALLMIIKVKFLNSDLFVAVKNLVLSANTDMVKTGSMLPGYRGEAQDESYSNLHVPNESSSTVH